MVNAIITGTGSYIPSITKENIQFSENHFLNADGSPFNNTNQVIIEKFKSITGIEERRYAKNSLNASDLGFLAAQNAINDAEVVFVAVGV